MALHVPKAPGMAQMMKEGARLYSGLEEAVYRNISACKEFAQSVRSAYGPNGMNKMIINHIDKQFVTSDAGTIIRELDVEHPAAKLMVLASQMQDSEVGDGTNFVISLAGALLESAEELLRLGVTAVEIADGYELVMEKCLEILPSLVCKEIKDIKNAKQVIEAIRPAVMSKQYGHEDFLANLVAKACISILPEKTTFNVDNIRICKILGSGLLQSEVMNGMVFKRQVEGDVTKAEKAKVVIYSCPVDITQTETKGTVLIKTANELLDFSRGEESLLEKQIKAIADAGVKIVVAGAKFGDMALHYLNKYNLMAVRLNSKFDLRRLAKTVGATVLPRMTTPTAEELGYVDKVTVDELGDTTVICFQMEDKNRTPFSYDNFILTINRELVDAIPDKKERRHNKKVPKPFWNSELTKACEEKKEALKTLKHNITIDNCVNVKQKSNEIRKLVKRAKAKYWKYLCEIVNENTSSAELRERMKCLRSFRLNSNSMSRKTAELFLRKLDADRKLPSCPEASKNYNIGKESRIATVVIRGATDNYMDDIERAIDDGVNTFKGIARDGRLLPGAGAVEMELAYQISCWADTLSGLAPHAARHAAIAFEALPRALADTAGVDATQLITDLYTAHRDGQKNAGFDIEAEEQKVCDVTTKGIYDLYALKEWGIKYAFGAATTILKVDQIIMAKRAGGPKPGRKNPGSDDES